MKIGNFSLWTSATEAADIGATHHGRFLGIVPGFICQGTELLWIPRTDALFWLEDALAFATSIIQALKGKEAALFFTVGQPISPKG